jgi:hypothetical protein
MTRLEGIPHQLDLLREFTRREDRHAHGRATFQDRQCLERLLGGRHRSTIEVMIVELKAPRVTIGPAEITQGQRYAMAVSQDERFHTVKGVRWHFWIVSNKYDDFAKEVIEGGPDPARRLIHRKGNISVGIKTWGELIEENRARLQFFQEQLQHSADESAAIRYLQERHSKYLEGVIEDDEENAAQSDYLAPRVGQASCSCGHYSQISMFRDSKSEYSGAFFERLIANSSFSMAVSASLACSSDENGKIQIGGHFGPVEGEIPWFMMTRSCRVRCRGEDSCRVGRSAVASA